MSLAGQLTGTEWNAGWKAGPTLAGGKPGVNACALLYGIITEHVTDGCRLPQPGCRTIVPVLRILFNRLSMLPSFQLLSGNPLSSLRVPH